MSLESSTGGPGVGLGADKCVLSVKKPPLRGAMATKLAGAICNPVWKMTATCVQGNQHVFSVCNFPPRASLFRTFFVQANRTLWLLSDHSSDCSLDGDGAAP